MLKSIINPIETREYISNLSSLINLIKESTAKNHNLGLQYLIDYVSLLKFKIDNNLMQKLKIDASSGMVSFGDISQLIAEKDNLELKKECNFTLEEIRDKLIKKIDSKNAQDFDISKKITSLTKRYYLSLLEKTNIDKDITLNANLVETGDSDLIRIIMSGYCLPLGSVCSCEADIYVQKKALGKKKIKIKSNADVSLSEEFSNKLTGWFGIQSNIVYEFIRKEKGFEPRRIKRTVFAPHYNRFFEPTKNTGDIDPYYLEIYENILLQQTPHILSIHTDTSTKHFDPFDEDKSKIEKPNITISNKYYCIDKKVARQLKKYVPEKDIITPKGK